MSETTETSVWADLDLTDVVEQVARVVWDQQKPPEIAWDRVNETTRHNAREAVLPFVVATWDALAPLVEARVAAGRAEALREAANFPSDTIHTHGDMALWLRRRAAREAEGGDR